MWLVWVGQRVISVNQFEWIVVKSDLPADIKEVLLELAEAMEDAVYEITDEALDNYKDNHLDDTNEDLKNLEDRVEAVEDYMLNLKKEFIRCHLCEKVLGMGQIAGASGEGIVCRECSN